MKNGKSVCVFCGASNTVPKKFLDIGAAFGQILAKKGVTLVYGGGDCGVMGAVANATMKENWRPCSLRRVPRFLAQYRE